MPDTPPRLRRQTSQRRLCRRHTLPPPAQRSLSFDAAMISSRAARMPPFQLCPLEIIFLDTMSEHYLSLPAY